MWRLQLSLQAKQLPWLLYTIYLHKMLCVEELVKKIWLDVLFCLVIQHTSSLLHEGVTIGTIPANSSKFKCLFPLLNRCSFVHHHFSVPIFLPTLCLYAKREIISLISLTPLYKAFCREYGGCGSLCWNVKCYLHISAFSLKFQFYSQNDRGSSNITRSNIDT